MRFIQTTQIRAHFINLVSRSYVIPGPIAPGERSKTLRLFFFPSSLESLPASSSPIAITASRRAAIESGSDDAPPEIDEYPVIIDRSRNVFSSLNVAV